MKSQKRNIKTVYALTAPCLVLLTGLFAMILGMTDLFMEETNKNITETFSTLIGSIYLSFLLGRFRKKNWKTGCTGKERTFYTAMGTGLAVARYLSRLLWILIEQKGSIHAAYISAILLDILALGALWFLMPASLKEVSPND